MEIPLRGFARVHINTFWLVLKNWKKIFSNFEKLGFLAIAILIVLVSFKWALAASQIKGFAPKEGGAFIEGVVSNDIESIDLGRLTKSGLTRINEKGEITPDLASSWEVSEDKKTYKFTIVNKISSFELAEQLRKNPIYTSGSSAEAVDPQTLVLNLDSANANLLNDMSQPIFPNGPFMVDKKLEKEIRLKQNVNYHLEMPYIEKFTVRIYPDKDSLQKAADKGKITGALNLDSTPKKWQSKDMTLGRKHFLFINSSKPYLKKTKTREALLNGTKPDGLDSLDVLEVNGEKEDEEFTAWKEKLKSAGIDIKSRKVSLKDALKGDLPKRNYDVLYILISEGQNHDPYLFWNSSQRSGAGQNFSEIANADLDDLTENYRTASDTAKQAEISEQIKKIVESEKVSYEYKSLTAPYSVSNKLKGFSVAPTCSSESDRFSQVTSWHLYEKKIR